MAVLLTYDIKKTTNTIHTELKELLKNSYGYSDKIKGDSGRWYDLPNTTLRKEGITTEQAAADFRTACKTTGAVWEKYIAAETTGSTFGNQ